DRPLMPGMSQLNLISHLKSMKFSVFNILLVVAFTATLCRGDYPSGGVFLGEVPGLVHMSIQATFGQDAEGPMVGVLVTCGEGRARAEAWLPIKRVIGGFHMVKEEEHETLFELHKFITEKCGCEATEETLDSYDFNSNFSECEVDVGNYDE
ncbi:hypothetical protein FOL47_005941, partial [Perkinsus chesapeaki]